MLGLSMEWMRENYPDAFDPIKTAKHKKHVQFAARHSVGIGMSEKRLERCYRYERFTNYLITRRASKPKKARGGNI